MTIESHTEARTLDRVVACAAHKNPRGGLTVRGRRGEKESRSFHELDVAAHRQAGRLAATGVRAGDVVLIALDTSLEWVETWLGAIQLGALPLAAAPAGAMGSGRTHLDKLDGIVQRLGVRLVVAGEGLEAEARAHRLVELADRVTTTARLAERTPVPFAAPQRSPEDVAFLQLTSGSTGLPRAVQVRHASALHNVHAIASALDVLPADATSHRPHGVSWLPLHHDMGLVGCLLSCLAHGWSLELIPPRQFLARPESWLAAIGDHARVISPAPNFAYQACIERETARRVRGTDLSRWAVGLTGAEMVRPATVDAFADHHASLGFDPRTIRASYGLAEATLAVTIDQVGRGLRTAVVPGDPTKRRVACVGAPVAETTVRITDAAGRTLSERTVGEVRVSGPGVFAGYRDDPEATADALRDGELVTGDLGFLQGGELYLTGRTKDILIIRGSNVMPHELEWCAEKVVGGGGLLRAGAFSVDLPDEGEAAVIVVETTTTNADALRDAARDVRLSIGHELGLALHDVALVRRGRIPKTSSGKVRRGELRSRYIDGRLERLDAPPHRRAEA